MKQFRRIIVTLLCIVLLLSAAISIGTSQARFVNAASWHGVYTPEVVTVKSNRLIEDGQTVMMADWYLDGDETYRDYTISLKTEKGTAQGNMSYQTPDSNLIHVSVDADGVIVNEEERVVTLSVELKDAALSLKNKTTASVVVSWTDIDRGTVLWADFSCTLIPVEKEETQPPTEKPTEEPNEEPTEELTEVSVKDQTEESMEAATEATEEATEESSVIEEQRSETELSVAAELEETEEAIAPGEPVEETSDDDEPTEVSPETSEPTEASSETSGPTEASSETSGPTEASSETSEPTEASSETSEPTEVSSETSEPTEKPTEPSKPTEPETGPLVPDMPVKILQYTESIAWDEWFGIQMAVPDGASYLEVYCNGSDFPKGTRFILNEGQEILPERAQTFIIPANGSTERLLLINMADVSESDRDDTIEIMVTANDDDGTEYSVDFVQIKADRKPLEFSRETAYPILSSADTMSIPCAWDASDVICKVERLVKNNDGGVYWEEGEYGLTVEIPQTYDSENEQKFVISNKNKNAPAGCYRITVRREFEGMVISEKYMMFFIHY